MDTISINKQTPEASHEIQSKNLVVSQKIRKLEPDELKTVIVDMPVSISSSLYDGLKHLNFKCFNGRIEKHAVPGFLPHTAVLSIFGECSYRKEMWLPKHQYIDFCSNGEYFFPSLYESIRLDENIVDDYLCGDIPLATVSIEDKSSNCVDMFLVEHVPMRMCCLTIPRKYSNPRFFTTTNLQSCYALTLWDHETKIACLAHFFNYEISEDAISTLKTKLISHGASEEHISAFVIGGLSLNMSEPHDYFHLIEKSLRQHKIRIAQTFIGNHSNRPKDILFDAQSGIMYQLKIRSNSSQYSFQCYEAKDEGTELHFRSKDDVQLTYRFSGSDKSEKLPWIRLC